MSDTLTTPKEWLYILNAERPLLSLEYLINDATINDVYDTIEIMEYQRYLRIEADKLEKLNGNKD